MPYVKIQITNDGVTNEKKLALIKGVTDLLADVMNKNPASTFVVIEEVSPDNWGSGGEQVSTIRARAKAAAGADQAS